MESARNKVGRKLVRQAQNQDSTVWTVVSLKDEKQKPHWCEPGCNLPGALLGCSALP